MIREKKDILGMKLEVWYHKSCQAKFGIGPGWATLYDIESAEQGKGHATELLTEAKKFYEDQGKKFGGSVALNACMRNIYKRLDIEEYDKDVFDETALPPIRKHEAWGVIGEVAAWVIGVLIFTALLISL